MCLHLLRFLQIILDRRRLRAALWTEKKSIWKPRWETKRNGTFSTLLRRGRQATQWKVTLRTTRMEFSFLMYVKISFYTKLFFFIEEEDLVYPYWFCISLFFEISKTIAMGMHRNKNSLLKPNKMKHWAKGRIPTTFFPPCVFQQTIVLHKLNMQLPLHKLNSQNVLFTVLFLLLKEKIYYKTTIKKYLLNTELFLIF